MINNGLPGEDADSENHISGSIDNSPQQCSTPCKEMNDLKESPKKLSTDDSESSLASGSDDEWKPSILKTERIIDPEKIIDIKTAEEPLFAVKEIVEISDYDDDEDKDSLPGNKAHAGKTSNETPAFVSGHSSPDDNSDCDASVPQTVKKSGEPPFLFNFSSKNNTNSSTGAIKKKTNPVLSNLQPITISKNPDAARLVRKLVEYFTFHNSLPDKEKHKHKHRLSEELMAVFSGVLNDCCNNIFLSVLQSEEFQNSNAGKKVKTKNVACQTVISGDILSSSLLSDTKGKISNDVNSSTKTDIETVIDLFNEYIVKMSVTENAE